MLRVPSSALRFRGPGGKPRPGPAVYVLGEGGTLQRIAVTPGLSDGTFTAVASDSLREGMPVVVAGLNASAGAAQGQVNPFAPGGMSRGRR